MSAEAPLFTVITPVRPRDDERALSRTIASVARWPAIEHVVARDSATAPGGAGSGASARVVEAPAGANGAAAFNAGLKAARGRFVLWLDPDWSLNGDGLSRAIAEAPGARALIGGGPARPPRAAPWEDVAAGRTRADWRQLIACRDAFAELGGASVTLSAAAGHDLLLRLWRFFPPQVLGREVADPPASLGPDLREWQEQDLVHLQHLRGTGLEAEYLRRAAGVWMERSRVHRARAQVADACVRNALRCDPLRALLAGAPLRSGFWRSMALHGRDQGRRLLSAARERTQRLSLAGPRPSVAADLTAVVYAVEPSHLLPRCLAAIEQQTLRPARVEVVKNVFPVGAAVQEGLERVQTEFYVSIDEDMILFPDCFARLYALVGRSPDVGEATLLLDDPIVGPVSGVRIYRTGAVRPLGFHPIEDMAWDRRMRAKLVEAGYRLEEDEGVGGLHHPAWLPHEAFWKFRFVGTQVRTLGDPARWYLDHLCRYWLRTGDLAFLYGMAGFFEGLGLEESKAPLTYEGRLERFVARDLGAIAEFCAHDTLEASADYLGAARRRTRLDPAD